MSRPRDRRTDRGAAVVDAVLVMVLLVPIVLGVLQVALVLFVRNSVASAAAEGARYAATADRDGGDGVLRTRQLIAQAVAARFAEGVRYRPTLVDGAPAAEIRVHLRVPALGLGGPAVKLDVVAHAIEEQP
ncbi:pilus assembly protein [Nocardioides sp. TRM66260-LWL]|uniref:TadE/TadG family type IV pilus assembly protein n=1 Tax=Nocardioides sp. TRM66260-LWL TaxID=2874478 RepID=UPI001CC4E128|nr:TadE/TadG family type IV pilus assembly protein [Nocardioides sp. TRM66260-LWL]MBZ5732902.1 pilus assembly protein [Nocardioides sp. TRM66260-LWL]